MYPLKAQKFVDRDLVKMKVNAAMQELKAYDLRYDDTLYFELLNELTQKALEELREKLDL